MKRTWIPLLLSLGLAATSVFAQSPEGMGTQVTKETLDWVQVLRQCSAFLYPLLATLFFGLVLSLYKLGMLWVEDRRSRILYCTPFAETSVGQIGQLLREWGQRSEMGQLLHLMFAKARRDEGNDDLYHAEIAHATGMRRDQFNTYRAWTQFLSDAAGALGLLGTVVGMYMTFFGGKLQETRILHGMAIALATTIVGLVISLILGLFLTFLSHVFDRQMEKTREKADELRHVLKGLHRVEQDQTAAGALVS
ncbi:MotA/TolQ/ExbB proton channel family protein [bacterium]|nr:MotA/TolQ/ExbB proton channel family protein [bacterium]MBU1983860.1 MotA/TolQ/ExbB proton channel family protein [bacterium]